MNPLTGSVLATRRALRALFLSALLPGVSTSAALAQGPPTVPERVAALKQSLAQSKMRLKQYEWIETQVVSLKGEEKSSAQNRCYYGADGNLQKVPVAAAPKETKKGLRGKIVAKKKEELTEYMQKAVALLKMYVPPDPDSIEASKIAGKVSLTPLQPGIRVRLDFRDYLKPGDTLSVDVNPSNNRLLGLSVATYLEDPKDKVSLDAAFAALNDGTVYNSAITLAAPGQNLSVRVKNTGYRLLSK
jgi:hypothetical protein